ncbi:type VI secretion system Vgr family protein [Zemynaea arenosa]|nr:type VI secretion system tip protein TssI/VgrG [Massilia arenosa]
MAQGAALLAAFAGERQHNRLLRLSFPREDGPAAVMLVNALRASEGLSRDFVFDVEVLADDASIPLNDVMGRMVTIAMVRDDGALRYFNGYVFEFGFDRTDGGLAFYRMQLRPWLAFLTLRQDCALFQHLNVLELCEKTFKNYPQQDYDSRLMGALPEMTLAVQYNESDYNHVHRRLEDAGLYYWYEHRADGHTLWVSDDSTVAMDIDGGDPVIEYRADSGAGEGDGISAWRPARAAASMRATVSSFNFKHAKSARSEHMSSDEQGMVPELEMHENTGAYGFPDTAAGDALAMRRTQELGVDANVFEAGGNHRALQPGRCFSVGGHFAYDAAGQEYLITGVVHDASNNYQDGSGAGSNYSNSFTCIRRDRPWRARRGSTSTHTRIYGVQTATVVGPPGEEIHTDSYGRVRVQFHWDRVGKFDAASSPWVRVMTAWAGTNFGQISLPRIGQEVVVQFLEGNPDRPLIVGSLYNATHMPPWELPANRTQSGILTRSSMGGAAAHANALRFEDRKGAEEVWLHAERDQRIEVEHDESHWVGHDRRKTIDANETVHVKGNRTETVDKDESITIHQNRKERVDQNEFIDIGGDREEKVMKDDTVVIHGARHERVILAKEETIGLGKALSVGLGYQVTVGGIMNTTVALAKTEEVGLSKTVIVGQHSSLTAQVEHRVTVGTSMVIISPNRVEILADEIAIRGRKKVEVHGDDVDMNPE